MAEGLYQKRSLGQVFLKVEWPVTHMVDRLAELGIHHVLEIGPGPGILTRALLARGIKVTAVEKDERFAERLRELHAADIASGELTVVDADVTRFDWDGWVASAGPRPGVCGNIPYNISSPILLRAMTVVDRLAAVLFMTQLEFAQRVVARHDTKDYGSLSVHCQLRAELKLEFTVPRTAFQPVPKVDSAVLLATPPREQLDPQLLARTEKITRHAFTQRRKKLRNSIRLFFEHASEDGCPIDLERRADSLSPREFLMLARFLEAADGQRKS